MRNRKSNGRPAASAAGGAILALAIGAAACGGNDAVAPTASPQAMTRTVVIDPGDGGDYRPSIDPARFVTRIDNPYMPLAPGSKWVYEGTSEGEAERIEIEVLAEHRTILGISATVVRDRVFVGGELVEDTFDWYAQDLDGNVWYLGEAVKDYQGGKVVSTDGSFEVGVDGALPGVVMPGTPAVGHAYRQEFYRGKAEDMAEILRVDARKAVPFGTFERVVVTRDWNPLDPEPVEEKYYARGIGLVFEAHTRGPKGSVGLVEFSPGG